MNELDLQIGLANIGNPCFFNSVLQSLRICPQIGAIFLTDTPLSLREKSNRTKFVQAFQTLMRDFWKETPPPGSRPTLIPRGFFQSLFTVLSETENDWYQRGQQADAAEAIQYILESLHDGMYRNVKMEITGQSSNTEEMSQTKAIESWSAYFSKEYSPIIQNFYGQTQICVRCDTCQSVSERYEPWLMLKVPIPGGDVAGGPAPTLDTCLSAAFAPESLDDYECDVCSQNAYKVAKEADESANPKAHTVRGKATITTRISRLPSTVILTIKRFTNEGNKVRGKLTWDLDSFDLSKVLAFSRNPIDADSKPCASYETFAVIEHHGSLQGGHYNMYAKQKDRWLQYDDSSIEDVAPDRVVSADSYILFLLPKSEMEEMNQSFANTIRDLRARCASS